MLGERDADSLDDLRIELTWNSRFRQIKPHRAQRIGDESQPAIQQRAADGCGKPPDRTGRFIVDRSNAGAQRFRRGFAEKFGLPATRQQHRFFGIRPAEARRNERSVQSRIQISGGQGINKWRLESLGTPGAETPVIPGFTLTVSFDGQGRANVHGHGTVALSDGSIRGGHWWEAHVSIIADVFVTEEEGAPEPPK